MNQWRQCGKYSVLVPSRCGSKSFGSVSTIPVRPNSPKVLAVRHPVSRFTSLWRFCQQGLITSKTNALLPIQNLSPDEMMDHIEANPDADKHWLPQVTYWSPEVTVCAYDKLYGFLGLLPIHMHKSLPAPPKRVPEARINMHYAEDVALWDITDKEKPRVGSGAIQSVKRKPDLTLR